MKTSGKKTLAVLAVLVLGLAVLLAVTAALKRSAARKEAAAASSGQVTAQDAGYTALSYSNSTATLSFAVDESGAWYWTDDPDFPLDESYVVKLINLISGLKPQQTITQGDTLEAYGLDQPAVTLTATDAAGVQSTFALGNTTTDGKSCYLLLNGAETPVYIIDGSLRDALSKGIYEMMELPQLPVLTDAQMASVTVDGAVQTVLIASADETAPADSSAASSAEPAVTWRSQGANVTDNQDVTSLLGEVRALTLSACQDYKPSAQAVTLCGFDAPRCTLTVAYTDGGQESRTLTLTVGKSTADGSGLYVRLADDTTVYSMTADSLKTLLSVADSGLGA